MVSVNRDPRHDGALRERVAAVYFGRDKPGLRETGERLGLSHERVRKLLIDGGHGARIRPVGRPPR